MPDPINVGDKVIVPPDALEIRAVRSSGPGGQNVNKVSSRIQIHVHLDRIQGLDDAGRARLRRLVANRLDTEGRLLVTSQRTREQHRNLEDARRKIAGWISRALEPPKKRIRTKPTGAGIERRLEQKRQSARRKLARRKPSVANGYDS